jgi:hypothetical protein
VKGDDVGKLSQGDEPSRDVIGVAAFGDSAMWGQGLLRGERYTALVLQMLPALYGKPTDLVWDWSRSGAQIRASQDEREVFLDRFPSLFHSDTERKAFGDGSDESHATGLYGEVPAPFPTIGRQVDMLGADVGQRVDVALLDGGANDINIEDIINPQISTGKFIERYDGVIQSVAYGYVVELLVRLRKKCPSAVILYFGLWAPLTEQSNRKSIENYFKYEFNDDFKWWLNMNVHQDVDVDALISEAITRSQWMRGRFHYWSRQAVKDVNLDAETRGPGVLFVPSGFTNDNAIYAPAPFLFDDYIHPTTDPAQARRVRECPRANAWPDLIEVGHYLLAVTVRNGGGPQRGGPQRGTMPTILDRSSADAAAALASRIDGPLKLKGLLAQWGGDWTLGWSTDFVANAWKELASEINRIQNAFIASLGHPNPLGAQSYAYNANRRLGEHQVITQQIDAIERHPGPLPVPIFGESLDAMLRRYRLRGSGSLHADAGHLDVDSLAVRVVTGRNSDANLRPDVWIVVHTRNAFGDEVSNNHRLNFKYTIFPPVPQLAIKLTKLYPHFEPGQTNLFTVDPLSRLRLEEITGCFLVLGADPIPALGQKGTTWRPSSVELEVNGVSVLQQNFPPEAHFEPGSYLDLMYPDPQPNFVPPELAPTAIAEADPF